MRLRKMPAFGILHVPLNLSSKLSHSLWVMRIGLVNCHEVFSWLCVELLLVSCKLSQSSSLVHLSKTSGVVARHYPSCCSSHFSLYLDLSGVVFARDGDLAWYNAQVNCGALGSPRTRRYLQGHFPHRSDISVVTFLRRNHDSRLLNDLRFVVDVSASVICGEGELGLLLGQFILRLLVEYIFTESPPYLGESPREDASTPLLPLFALGCFPPG